MQIRALDPPHTRTRGRGGYDYSYDDDIIDGGVSFSRGSGGSCGGSGGGSCFTADCLVEVVALSTASTVSTQLIRMADLQLGQLISTGLVDDHGEPIFRELHRLWRFPTASTPTSLVHLSDGCVVTPSHWVLFQGRWMEASCVPHSEPVHVPLEHLTTWSWKGMKMSWWWEGWSVVRLDS